MNAQQCENWIARDFQSVNLAYVIAMASVIMTVSQSFYRFGASAYLRIFSEEMRRLKDFMLLNERAIKAEVCDSLYGTYVYQTLHYLRDKTSKYLIFAEDNVCKEESENIGCLRMDYLDIMDLILSRADEVVERHEL